MQRLPACLIAIVACLIAAPAVAQPYNLDFLQPVTVEDAYPTETGKMQVQVLSRFETPDDNWLIVPEFQWGFAENWQLEVGVPLWAGGGDQDGSGDIQIGALWQFAEEQDLPALALAGEVVLPTGEDSAGLDTTLEFIATHSLTQEQSADKLHLNLAWTHDAGAGDDVDENRLSAVLGYSRALSQNTTFVADLVYSEQKQEGVEWVLLEAGVTHQLNQHWSLSGGVGTGLNDDGPDLLLMGSVQYQF